MFLKIEGLSFGYTKERLILNDVTLELERSKTLALVGSSGCGKSTLLRIIAGILTNSSGHVLNGEINIDGITPEKYRKTGKFAFMFQEPTLFPNRTVFENVRMPLEILNRHQDHKVESLLKSAGLYDYKNYYPKSLSGGMKTRVALCRSFVTEPELLLLDEPFSALDIAWKYTLYKELQRLQQTYNTTIIMVSHDLHEAIHLSENKVIALGPTGNVLINTMHSAGITASDIELLIVENHAKKTKTYVA